MKSKDQQLLEEAYQKIVRQGVGYGTKLPPYSMADSQISDQRDWARGGYDSNLFQGFERKLDDDKQGWTAILKFNNKDIKISSRERGVLEVDGKVVPSAEASDLKKYIYNRYAPFERAEREGGMDFASFKKAAIEFLKGDDKFEEAANMSQGADKVDEETILDILRDPYYGIDLRIEGDRVVSNR